MKKIVIDAFGGDNAPSEVVKGVKHFLEANDEFKIILCGDEEKIKQELEKNKLSCEFIEIFHAPDVVTNDDIPTKAIKEKTNSSLVACFDILKKDEDCIGLISAGSTGAILTGGFLKIGRIRGVSRPALAPFLPTKKGGNVLICDCGANMDANAVNLCHFALMGSAYYTAVTGIEKPRVALLNVGTEDHKGDELCHEVFPLLEKLDINFVGNMEARDIMSGNYDVVVCDGFAGNVLLKSTEGALKLMLSELKDAIQKNAISKFGALLMKKSLKNMKKKYDFNAYGGCPFLGCKKLIYKAHGSSKASSFVAALNQVVSLDRSKIIEKLGNCVEIDIESLKSDI